MLKDLTFGQIFKALSNEIFLQPVSEIEKQYREREISIKQYLNICGELINANVKYFNETHEIDKWEEERLKKNVKNLLEYTDYLVQELDKDKIEKYISGQSTTSLNFKLPVMPFNPDITFLISNSVHGAIINDILWAHDLTMMEAMSLSGGKLGLKDLDKKLPSKLKEIETSLIPFLKGQKNFKKFIPQIEESIECFNKALYKASILLLITTIEGIVKELAFFLNHKQGLNLDLSERKYSSISALLRNVNWKEDFEINSTQLELLTSMDDFFPRKKVSIDKTLISVKTRLHFLIRRFKSERDMILHGQNVNYGNQFHLFLNLSALTQVGDTLKYYIKKYK